MPSLSAEEARDEEALIDVLIDGRYRVERSVGSGGFGTVYLARHLGLGSPVALKVLKLPARLKADQLATLCGAFFEEARTLKRLRHPGIVAALDVGLLAPDGAGVRLPYLVMEWCGGPTLKRLLDERRGVAMTLDEAWALFEPLLAALEHAHAAGVVHRDLKPANVLLEPAGEGRALRPCVIDFGIAKIVGPEATAGTGVTHTASGSSPFTPRYAAPEQLAQARTGPWTDVHALALLFVELVRGAPAIGSDADATLAVFDPRRPTPKMFGVDVGALEPVLAKALAVRPMDRYPDAAAIGCAMRDVAASGWRDAPAQAVASIPAPIAARRATHDETAPPSSHTLRTAGAMPPARARRARSRALVAPAGALALALALGAVAVQHQRHAWPFARRRLRDLTAEQLGRRVAQLDLGVCSDVRGAGMLVYSCQSGAVGLYDIPYAPDGEMVPTYSSAVASGLGQAYGAAELARDGAHLLVVAGPRAKVPAALDLVLGGALFDERKDVSPPAPPPRSAATHAALSRWISEDLLAAITATGRHPTTSNATATLATATLADEGAAALVTLFPAHGAVQLAAWKAPDHHFVYARDGDSLLMIGGNAPALESVDYMRQLLDGAHVDEVGAYPPP